MNEPTIHALHSIAERLKNDIDYTDHYFEVYYPASVSVPNSTWTQLTFTKEIKNPRGLYNTSNGRFTAQVSGWYVFTLVWRFENTSGAYRYVLNMHKNGSSWRYFDDREGSGSKSNTSTGTVQTYLQAGDYIEPYFWHNVGSTRSYPTGTSSAINAFSGHLVRVEA